VQGTEKHPDENEWSEWVSENGGHSNAFTSLFQTNYHCETKADVLEPLLDRFSGFFTCPLFKEESVERELLAVDAEHSKNTQNDSWRLYQLDKSTSHPDHPYSSFGTGDTRTLRDMPREKGLNTREEVVKLHKQHYSAGRMSLAIVGKQPVDVIEGWVRKYFSSLTNNGSVMPVVERHPYHGQEPVIQYAVPVKDTRSVTVIWQMPPDEHLYKSKPSNYLSHLIGHEGPGSVLSYLKARGWALGLSAGGDSHPGYASFEVGIDLTEEGLKHVHDVVASLYAYIGMLRAEGVKQNPFDEEAKQAASSVRFMSKSKPIWTVTDIAQGLLLWPIEDSVVGHRLFREFKKEEIEERLRLFEPQNSRVRIVSKALADKCTESERWYGTKYAQEKMSDALIQQWKAASSAYERLVKTVGPANHRPVTSELAGGASSTEGASSGPTLDLLASNADAWAKAIKPVLAMPDPNDFLASDFRLRNPALAERQLLAESSLGMSMGGEEDEEDEEEGDEGEGDEAAEAAAAADLTASLIPARRRREPIPTVLRDDGERSLVWFNQDTTFGTPKLYLYADLQLPAAYSSPQSYVLTDLFVKLLNDSLNEFAYSAELADIRYRVSVTVNGLSLTVGGFSHKLHLLVAKVAQRCRELTFSDQTFAAYLDRAIRAYQNWDKEQPLHHAMFATNMMTMTPLWSAESKLECCKRVNADDLRQFQKILLSQCRINCLISGNATSEEALLVADALINPLASKESAPLPVYPGQGNIQRVTRLPLPLLVTSTPLASASGITATLTGHAASRFTSLCWEYHHSHPSRNADDPNAAMEYILQIGPTPIGPLARQTAMYRLAAHILSEPYFDQLRTKQALGYIVQCGMKIDGSVRSIRFLAQSNKVNGAELVKRTESFLSEFMPKFLSEMTPAKFRANVAGVITKVNEATKNANEEASTLWAEISDNRFDFSRGRYTTDALAEIMQHDFNEWFAEHILPGGSRRRVLVSVVEPATAPVASAPLINAAKAAEEPLDSHAEKRVAAEATAVATADQGATKTLAVAAAEGDAAAKSLTAGIASPAVGSSTTAVASPVTGSEVVREDAVGTAASAAVEAKGAVTSEAEVQKPAAAEEVIVRVTPAQAALVFSALSSADISEGGGRTAVPDHLLPFVYSAFADAGIAIEGFIKLAKQRNQHYVRIIVQAKTTEDVRAGLPLYPHYAYSRLEAFRENLIKMTKPSQATK
jgi:secreted Zn-dependent insulinase-like peptidase